jgi:hypothetical protein
MATGKDLWLYCTTGYTSTELRTPIPIS